MSVSADFTDANGAVAFSRNMSSENLEAHLYNISIDNKVQAAAESKHNTETPVTSDEPAPPPSLEQMPPTPAEPLKEVKRGGSGGKFHSRVLEIINPKPRIVTKYNIGGICKRPNPDPLAIPPYGIYVHTLDFSDSAFDMARATYPKFLVGVVGSFPSLGMEFHKTTYGRWKRHTKGIYELWSEEGPLTIEEGSQLLALLDKVVAARAQCTRKFISAAQALYKGKDEEKLPNVITPWLRPFYEDIDEVVIGFFKTLEHTKALAEEAPVVVDEN